MDTTPMFDVEQGLLELPGSPARWIWAFTCPIPKCACRVALVLSTPGKREMLLDRGRPVAEAWRGRSGRYCQAARDLQGVTAFTIDLDTHALFPPVGNVPLDAAAHPEVPEIADRVDDEVLDAIARLWHRGKGKEPPREPGAGGAEIEVEGWRPGDTVVWKDARPALRGDTYVFGERIFEAVEIYCVEPDCDCEEVIVDFRSIVPRGAPHPGYVKIRGGEATRYPSHGRTTVA